MLAPAQLPPAYQAWNRQWHAPFGRPWRHVIPKPLRSLPGAASLAGMFAFQPNNSTRAFEYPWAIEALALEPGMRVLEIGGGSSGFQFALDRQGCRVTNVDPGARARGKGWTLDPARFDALNRRFGTRVELKGCFIEEAGLADASFERAVSISTIEHIPEDDIVSILGHIRRVLVPGGLFVLTLDLFLDVEPFTSQKTNRYGKNISARWLAEHSGMEMIHGNPTELYGFDEFRADAIQQRSSDYLIGSYPALIQTMVLCKPAQG